MDLLCHKLLFILLNEAQWVRHRDARLSHFKEPRAFDVAVTLLVFLKELLQNESSAESCSQGESVAPTSLLFCSAGRKCFLLGWLT